MITLVIIILCVVAVLLLSLLFKILKAPIRWALKLFLNALIGFVALLILNILGSFVGISLGMNWINAIITGVLGIPGIILLLLWKYLL